MDACLILIMAIKREELSQTNWVYQDGTTRLLELDTTNGVNIRATAKAGKNFLVTAPAAALRVACGQLTTASATDTVVTGLTTVISVVASYDTDPADANLFCSATIGDQAGAPAAGSIIIKTWKTADGTDPTPTAATGFSKKVNWIAVGT